MAIENLKLYDAKVIKIDDSDKQGKIQIQPLPELKDASTDNLPWAIPFMSNNSTGAFENHLPEVDSIVKVLIRDDWQRFYYLGNKFFCNLFDFSKVTSALGEVSDTGLDTTYKYIDFVYYLDGGLSFHNNNTGEHGFVHNSGSYNVYDSSGSMYANSGSHEITLKNNGGITIDSGTGDLEFSGMNVSITGTTKTEIKGTTTNVTGDASLTLKGAATNITGGTLTINGVAAPTASGGFCAIALCPLSCLPHTGNVLVGT